MRWGRLRFSAMLMRLPLSPLPFFSRRSWDIRSLCRPAGQEYVAYTIGAPSPSPAASPAPYVQNIRFSAFRTPSFLLLASPPIALLELRATLSCPFSPCPLFAHPLASPDLCGTVAQVVAPYLATPPAGTANMELPLPHSHGTAVQYIDDPGKQSTNVCPDVDTCDQETNPACLPGSPNYPPGGNPGNNPFTTSNPDFTPAPIARNIRREQRCASATPPFYCTVQNVPCEGGVEVLAYYDGAGAVRARPSAQTARAIP